MGTYRYSQNPVLQKSLLQAQGPLLYLKYFSHIMQIDFNYYAHKDLLIAFSCDRQVSHRFFSSTILSSKIFLCIYIDRLEVMQHHLQCDKMVLPTGWHLNLFWIGTSTNSYVQRLLTFRAV